MADKDMKQAIMKAALSLVEQGDGRLEEVTVREIAAVADVGVGLINYHFGSKDELLRLCAQTIVSEELERFHQLVEKLAEVSPIERLRCLAKRNCDYLAERPNLSRMSIFTDLRRGDFAGDNTDQNMEAFLPLVAAASDLPEHAEESRIRTHILVHAFQAAFLRSASVKARIGLDFFQKQDRDRFVDLTIDQLFQEEKV